MFFGRFLSRGHMIRRIIVLALLCLPNVLLANRFVAEGYCVIVLASKPTVEQAVADARIRWSDHDVTIYRSKNGWFAITGARLASSQQAHTVKRLKVQGKLPPDAFCSSGNSFIAMALKIASTAPNSAVGKQTLLESKRCLVRSQRRTSATPKNVFCNSPWHSRGITTDSLTALGANLAIVL